MSPETEGIYISFHSLTSVREGKKSEHSIYILKQVVILIFTHMYEQIIVRSLMSFSRSMWKSQ